MFNQAIKESVIKECVSKPNAYEEATKLTLKLVTIASLPSLMNMSIRKTSIIKFTAFSFNQFIEQEERIERSPNRNS